MSDKLLPCPFCGGEVTLKYSSRTKTFVVGHKYMADACRCKIVQPFEIVEQLGIESLADARAVWNRRAK